MDDVLTNRTNQLLATQLHQLLGLFFAKSGTAFIDQDLGDSFHSRLGKLLGKNILIEQGIHRRVMQLFPRENLFQGRIIGTQGGAQLVFLVIDLLRQVTGKARAVARRLQIRVFGE